MVQWIAGSVKKEFNKHIKRNDELLFMKNMYDKSMMYINDILDGQGHLLKLEMLNHKYKLNISIMYYNSLKYATPKIGRKIVKDSTAVDIYMYLMN